ncbi:opioid growth factor receptor-like isoform X2 [Carassius carassius]|uniref:opioid growth factor receptor-like isoform X2 n=1 Tax=Carassius carassius TaxID=217509 RepID=UPI0028687C05|nr:opioid growth factor receptor-like isoform X2 [Carassius carassius]
MSFKRALRVLCWGLYRFFRALPALGWRVLSKFSLRFTRQINMSGDECEYDSTWEDGDEYKKHRKKNVHHYGESRRNMFAARDMQKFRHSCRGLDNISDDDDGAGEQDTDYFYNLEFYRGNIRSSPDELYISDFHQQWQGQYEWLEDVHSYIQWLFPIQEPGVNWRAHVLSKKEIKLFRKDEEAKKKLVQSYKLMLDFYGIHLTDESTGKVTRAPNWKDRFRNLNRHTHNNLRITRILKCLGTLGLKHYQAPLVRFFLNETLVMGELQNVKKSALDYFMFAVLDKSDRRELVKFAYEHFNPQKNFVWGTMKILSGQVDKQNCKNENMDQPTENNSSNAEDQQKRENLHESKHKTNKTDTSHPLKEMQITPNTLTETNSENENEGVVKKKNQDLSVGVGEDNENTPSANKSHGHGAVSGSHQTEDKRKKDHQNNDEPAIPKKSTETNSDQLENKDRQCSSENGDVVKQNHEISVSDDNENIAPANKSHDHDAFDGSHQTEEGSVCQVHDEKLKDETEDKGLQDNKKRLNPHESEHEDSHSLEEIKSTKDHQNKSETVISNKLTESNSVNVSDDNKNTAPANKSHGHDAASGSHLTEEKRKKDHQNNDESAIPKKSTETNSDQWENESGQCSSENGDGVKQNHGMSDDDGVGVSDNNENIALANKSHGHDAFDGSHQTEEGSSCQGHDVEMKDETEYNGLEDNQKRLNPHESEHEVEKIGASHSPEEMKSKKDKQNKKEPVIPNESTEANSVNVSDDNENTAPANKTHGHDAASGSHQTEVGSSCQVQDVEMKDGTENKHEKSENEQ